MIANATTLGATLPLMKIYRETLEALGKQVSEFPIARECYVGTSHKTAMEECRAALEYKYNSYAAWGMESPTKNMTFEEMARDRFIIGDKISVKEEIARWTETLGVNGCEPKLCDQAATFDDTSVWLRLAGADGLAASAAQ